MCFWQVIDRIRLIVARGRSESRPTSVTHVTIRGLISSPIIMSRQRSIISLASWGRKNKVWSRLSYEIKDFFSGVTQKIHAVGINDHSKKNFKAFLIGIKMRFSANIFNLARNTFYFVCSLSFTNIFIYRTAAWSNFSKTMQQF